VRKRHMCTFVTGAVRLRCVRSRPGPPDEPPEELRRAEAMLRRARTVLTVSVMLAMCLLSMWR
ncbi:hypothetical protein, partial [Streptomyces sp. NPDC022067]|uniref:morphogenic membrane protein MmpB n=1 Tax=Streptomyces sp. NPDC022067 TaxID=3154906 RepID=UPI0034030497